MDNNEIDYTKLADLDIERMEVELIKEALRRAPKPEEAARLLGISRFALGRRLDKFGIRPERRKRPRKTQAEGGPVGEAPSEMVFTSLPEEPAGESAA